MDAGKGGKGEKGRKEEDISQSRSQQLTFHWTLTLPPSHPSPPGNGCARIQAQGMQHTGEDPTDFTNNPHGYFPKGPHKAAKYGTGGLLVTKSYYASGRYEVGMKPMKKYGMATCMWTFAYFSNSVCGGSAPAVGDQPYCPNDCEWVWGSEEVRE